MKTSNPDRQERLKERDPLSYAVIGAAMDVHAKMGRGFLEAVYHEALVIEFKSRGIPFQREIELRLTYKGHELACQYKADFVCFGSLIVEIKAIRELTERENAQIINYLRATEMQVGLLINFASQSLEFRRFVDSRQQQGC